MNRQNGFAKIFVFVEIFDRKVKRSGVCGGHAIFSLNTELFIFLKYCNFTVCVNTSKYLFLADCNFNFCEKPSKFCIVIDYDDIVSV